MFGSLGIPELLLIFAVALIVFGPRKLPEIGRTLGKALGEFKKATDELKSTIEREVRVEEQKQLVADIVRPMPETTVSRSGPVADSLTVEAVPVEPARTADAIVVEPASVVVRPE